MPHDFANMTARLVDTFGEPELATYSKDGVIRQVRVIVEDPIPGMELPAGAIKLASFTLDPLWSPPAEADAELEVQGQIYRVITVRVDYGGLVRMTLAQ